jgi:threonine aldolase
MQRLQLPIATFQAQFRVRVVDARVTSAQWSAMRFFSDNAASVHPAVLEALAAANHVDTAYDGDALSKSLDGAFSDLFETPVTALWVASGTAANALALASLCPPHGSILCHRDAHIQNDECGAPEFYTHGAKLLLGEGEGAKLNPETAAAALDAVANDVHRVQPHAMSITNATEYGCVYTPDEVAALGALAKARGLGFHMDGARFANAVAHLGCSPADVTWRAGVDILSFGFVKNGGMNAEALIFFKPELVGATPQRRKRAGHLLSKGRFLATQLLALLEEDRWLTNARAANAKAQVLAEAADERLLDPVEANELFLAMEPGEAASLRAQGFDFYDWAEGEVRFVVSWDQDDGDIAKLAAAIADL